MKKLMITATLVAAMVASYANAGCKAPVNIYQVVGDTAQGHSTVLTRNAQEARNLVTSGQGWRHAHYGPSFVLNGIWSSSTLSFYGYFNEKSFNHFYTYKRDERLYVENNGWVRSPASREVAYIYTRSIQGLTPLYRLHKVWGTTPAGGSDVQHYYTTSPIEVSVYQSRGFTLDGVAGYACKRRGYNN